MQNQMWTYREETWLTSDLTGFKVEALDGEIGSIDEESNDVGSSYLVVDTGPWIFGKKVLLPAGVIDRVDLNDRRRLRQPDEGRDPECAGVRRDPVHGSDLPQRDRLLLREPHSGRNQHADPALVSRW